MGIEEQLAAIEEGRIRSVVEALPKWPDPSSRAVLARLARVGEGARFDGVAHGISVDDASAFADAIATLVAMGARETAAYYVGKRTDAPSHDAGLRAMQAEPDVALRDMHRLPDDALDAFARVATGYSALAVDRLRAARAVAAFDFERAAEL